NQARVSCRVSIWSAYDGKWIVDTLPRGRALEKRFWLKSTFGWYDLSVKANGDEGFLRRVAGHLENGRDSVSDPALAHLPTPTQRRSPNVPVGSIRQA